MSVMKRDINFGLFLIIIAVLVLFATFTIYYQTTYKNMTTNYNYKLEELKRTSEELGLQKSRLNETSYELEIKVEREQDLSGKYTGLKGERDKLQSDKEKLEIDLSSTKSQLAEKSAQLVAKESELAQKTSELASAKTQIINLIDERNNYKAQRDSCNDDLNECESEKAICTCP